MLMVATLALLLPVPSASAATIETVTTQSIYGCLRTNGAAVYDSTVNKTFVTYSGTNQDIYIKAHDHATGIWSAATKVATLNVTHSNAYHDYPVLRQLSDGRLVIFQATHTASLQMYTAPTPRSITGTYPTGGSAPTAPPIRSRSSSAPPFICSTARTRIFPGRTASSG